MKNVGADGAFHRGDEGLAAQPERAFPAGNEDDGRRGDVLVAVDLMLEIGGEVLLHVDDGIILAVAREVAERIANVFDNLVWNKKSPLSPRVTNVQQDGTVITLTADQKLRTVTQLYEFETAGSDGRFRNAEASADGNRIIIRSAVENPVKVRYAWKNNPLRAGIYSEAGVPMSPMQLDLSEYGK